MREVTGESAVMWGTSIVGYNVIDHAGSRGRQRLSEVDQAVLRTLLENSVERAHR